MSGFDNLQGIKLGRRGLLQTLGVAAIGISFGGLAACSKGDSGGKISTGEEPKLNFYNWDTYIGETTLADFKAASGVDVKMDLFDSNDVLFAKFKAGNPGYDVIVPSNDFVERMATAGIKLQFPEKPGGSDGQTTVDVLIPNVNPGGVSEDGVIDDPMLSGNTIQVSAEAAALFNRFPTSNAGAIQVYFVKDLVRPNGVGGINSGFKGSSTVPSHLDPADKKYANRILISVAAKTPWTLAHELMHPLLDSAHITSEYGFVNSGNTTRLWAETHSRTTFDATKRILHHSADALNQRKALKASKLAQPPKQ